MPEFVPPPEDVAFIDASGIPVPVVSELEVRIICTAAQPQTVPCSNSGMSSTPLQFAGSC